MESAEKKTVLITIDVEDWFQVENFKNYINFSSWDTREIRVEKNIHTILDILAQCPSNPRATFFILGWVAKRFPGLVRHISEQGHEIASHGFSHELCTKMSKKELLGDLQASKSLLEDITGVEIIGYRAPSFAVDNSILDIIKEAGYIYDSSYNSFSMHDRYGVIDLTKAQQFGNLYKISENFFEIPISNFTIGDKILPLGGGGYFRLIPFWIFKLGMQKVLNKDNSFLFYTHPWEFDPEQPRVPEAPRNFKFRHYINLKRTGAKLTALLETFRQHAFFSCSTYLNDVYKSIS